MCHLKQSDPAKTVEVPWLQVWPLLDKVLFCCHEMTDAADYCNQVCEEALQINSHSVKACTEPLENAGTLAKRDSTLRTVKGCTSTVLLHSLSQEFATGRYEVVNSLGHLEVV